MRLRRCRDPPAAKLRFTGGVGGEAYGFEGEIYVCGSFRHCGCGVIKQLPIALPEENAEGSPGAQQCGKECETKSAEQPRAGDSGGRWLALWR